MINREQFEAWVRTRNVCTKYNASLKQNRDGSYADFRINDRWLAWQASRKGAVEELTAALALYEKAFDDLFSSCLSNGVFNAWGGTVDCRDLNEAHYMSTPLLKKYGGKV